MHLEYVSSLAIGKVLPSLLQNSSGSQRDAGAVTVVYVWHLEAGTKALVVESTQIVVDSR